MVVQRRACELVGKCGGSVRHLSSNSETEMTDGIPEHLEAPKAWEHLETPKAWTRLARERNREIYMVPHLFSRPPIHLKNATLPTYAGGQASTYIYHEPSNDRRTDLQDENQRRDSERVHVQPGQQGRVLELSPFVRLFVEPLTLPESGDWITIQTGRRIEDTDPSWEQLTEVDANKWARIVEARREVLQRKRTIPEKDTERDLGWNGFWIGSPLVMLFAFLGLVAPLGILWAYQFIFPPAKEVPELDINLETLPLPQVRKTPIWPGVGPTYSPL